MGFTIDLVKGNFYVPDSKLERLKASIKTFPFARVLVKSLASIVGKIICMLLAIGPVSHLRTRASYPDINSQCWKCDNVMIPTDARDEFIFWYHNINGISGKPIWFNVGATRVVYSDTSDSRYGGYMVELVPDVALGQ